MRKEFRDLLIEFGLLEYWSWKGDCRLSKSLTCQRMKEEHQRSSGLIQSSEISDWKYECNIMNYIVELLWIQSIDAIWVIIDILPKLVHF